MAPAEALAEAERLLDDSRLEEAIAILLTGVRANPEDAALRWRLADLYIRRAEFEFAESHLKAALDLGMAESAILPALARALRGQDNLDGLIGLELPKNLDSAALNAVLFEQASGLIEHGRLDAADTLASQLRRTGSDKESATLVRVEILLARQNTAAAERTLREFLQNDPRSADALALLGRLVRRQGHLREAETLLQRAADAAPASVPFRFLLADVQLDLGELDDARRLSDQIHANANNTFPDHYLRGRIALAEGLPIAAWRRFEVANTLHRDDPRTLLYGGVAAAAVGKTALAEQWLLRFLREYPANPEARVVLGILRLLDGAYSEAEDIFTDLPGSVLRTDAPTRLLAASLIAQGKTDKALTQLLALAKERPKDPHTRLNLAVGLGLAGSVQSASTSLSALIGDAPDFAPAYRYLIALQVRTGQWQAAQRWASRFRERFGDDAEIAALEGDVLLGAGMPLQAKQAFEAALTIDPTHEGASLGLAELALRNGQLASAAGRLRAFAEREPDRLDALLALATIAERAGQADEALTAWRRAVEIHPGAIEPRMALARLLRERGDADRAVSALRDNAPGAFRRDAGYLRALAETAFDAGMAELAAEAARDLVVLRPNALSAYRLYAAILAALGDKAALEETLEQILVRAPADVSTRLELARVYVASGRLPLAERLLDPLLTEPNRPAPVDFLYGLILAGTDRATQAIEPLEGAHRAMASRRTLLALADATAQIGQVDEAISRVATWLETFPNDVMVRLSLAGYLVRAERVSEAVAEYERVVAQEPDHAIALNNLAWYTLESDAVSAIDYARRAMDLSPDSLEIAHTLVSAQTAAEEWREAELTLDRVLPMHPNDSALLWLSARVLYQRGKPRDARARLERLLRQTPSDAERDRATELLARLNREILASELQ